MPIVWHLHSATLYIYTDITIETALHQGQESQSSNSFSFHRNTTWKGSIKFILFIKLLPSKKQAVIYCAISRINGTASCTYKV